MKLVRFGPFGGERPGLIDSNNQIRDIAHLIPDIAGHVLTADMLDMLRKLDPEMLPLVEGTVRLGACVGNVRNFIGVGLNYKDHAAEMKKDLPSEPLLFSKAPSCIIGANDPIMLPRDGEQIDVEGELAIIMGRRGSYIKEEHAYDYIGGYCICNDVTNRREQHQGTGQYVKAKSAPTFGPLGPYFVTTDEIIDPHQLAISTDVNGKKLQRGTTANMIFKIPELISYISRFMALEPGDVITTGTPAGVGYAHDPQIFLKKNDRVKINIEHLGQQEQKVLAWID